MKKLILVTLLAVAASWLLHEARQSGDEKAAMTVALDKFKVQYGDAPRHVIVLDDGKKQLAPVRPAPPVRPEPPSPPESIRTIPWRPARDKPSPIAKKDPSSKAAPSWFPKSEADEEAREKPDAFGSKVLLGRLSASEDRARQDLRKIVEREVADWLAADIPPSSWKVPGRVIDAMAQASHTQQVTKSLTPNTETSATPTATPELPGFDGLYTLYQAGQKLDFSSARRTEIVGMYRRDLAAQRMHRLGGGLALALVGLAVLSGYIKADEATKGYYTNRIRLVAAAGLGAAGVTAYRFLT